MPDQSKLDSLIVTIDMKLAKEIYMILRAAGQLSAQRSNLQGDFEARLKGAPNALLRLSAAIHRTPAEPKDGISRTGISLDAAFEAGVRLGASAGAEAVQREFGRDEVVRAAEVSIERKRRNWIGRNVDGSDPEYFDAISRFDAGIKLGIATAVDEALL